MDNSSVTQAVKRQMREEIGEQELNKIQRLALLEKYGFVAPRIDRSVTMPQWMERWEFAQEEKPWKRRFKQWKEMTRGMVFGPERFNKRPSGNQMQSLRPTSAANDQRNYNPATKFESRSTENGRQGRFSQQNRDLKRSSEPQKTGRPSRPWREIKFKDPKSQERHQQSHRRDLSPNTSSEN